MNTAAKGCSEWPQAPAAQGFLLPSCQSPVGARRPGSLYPRLMDTAATFLSVDPTSFVSQRHKHTYRHTCKQRTVTELSAIISCSQRLRPIPCFTSSPLFALCPLKVWQVLHRHTGSPWMSPNPPALLSPHLFYQLQSPGCPCPKLCLEVFDGPLISSWRLLSLQFCLLFLEYLCLWISVSSICPHYALLH